MVSLNSELGKINWFDIIKTFVIIVGTTVFGSLIPIISTGQMPTKENFMLIGGTALAAGFTYLLKQFGTNSDGLPMVKEK
jgi:hypothetical protein